MSFERFALIVTSTTLLALGTLHWAGVTGNLTESEPPGLYFRTLTSPRRGAMVELRPLMKHVAAIAGDTVRVTPEGSYVNGRLWPNSAIPTDTYGFQPFRFGTYKLQPGQYWVLGSSSDSYDSRWFGPIPDDVVAFSIKPLWTTSNGYAPGTKPWSAIWTLLTGDNPGTRPWFEQVSQHSSRPIDPHFKPPALTH